MDLKDRKKRGKPQITIYQKEFKCCVASPDLNKGFGGVASPRVCIPVSTSTQPVAPLREVPPDWIVKVAASPNEVHDFLKKIAIEEDVRQTVQLGQQLLPPESSPSLAVECDGDSDEEWLVVNLTINAPRTEVFALFNRFVDAWIRVATKSARRRMRLTYSAR